MIQPFTTGPAGAVVKLNEMIRLLNQLESITGDGFVEIKRTASGLTASLNINRLRERMPTGGMGAESGNTVQKAYCTAAAGASSSIAAELGWDGSGLSISANCSIAGGGNLNAAVPRLANNDVIFVSNIMGVWWCLTVFQASENCDCYSA